MMFAWILATQCVTLATALPANVKDGVHRQEVKLRHASSGEYLHYEPTNGIYTARHAEDGDHKDDHSVFFYTDTLMPLFDMRTIKSAVYNRSLVVERVGEEADAKYELKMSEKQGADVWEVESAKNSADKVLFRNEKYRTYLSAIGSKVYATLNLKDDGAEEAQWVIESSSKGFS